MSVILAGSPAGTEVFETEPFERTLLAATHYILFSAPFAVIAIAIAECLTVRHIIYYLAAALAIALTGFAAQYANEGRDLTILNSYALTAFAVAGLTAGLVYWGVAGRRAGSPARTWSKFVLPPRIGA